MPTQVIPSDEKPAGRWPIPRRPGEDPLRNLMRTLYALAFLIMLLLVLSVRVAREEAAPNPDVTVVRDNIPPPDRQP